MVVAEAHQRTGSRTEKGRSYHCGSGPRSKVQRCGEPGAEARQTNDLIRKEGEHRGGTPPPREVFPLGFAASRIRPGRLMRFARGVSIPQLQIVVQVAARHHRAALCAARLVAPLPEPAPTAVPWRERPPEMTAWCATPAATDVVAHATLKGVGAHVGGRHSAASIACASTHPKPRDPQ